MNIRFTPTAAVMVKTPEPHLTIPPLENGDRFYPVDSFPTGTESERSPDRAGWVELV